LQKTDPSRPWTGLPIQVPGNAHALFGIAVKSVVGNGESTKFGLIGGSKEKQSWNWLRTFST